MKRYTKTNCSFLQSRFSQKPASAKVTGTGNSLRKGSWESPIRKGSRKGSEQRQEEAGRIQGRVLAITWPLGSPERQTYRTVCTTILKQGCWAPMLALRVNHGWGMNPQTPPAFSEARKPPV